MQLKARSTLYKHQWKIGLFFKWIKQHLKITVFWDWTEKRSYDSSAYLPVIAYTMETDL